MTNASPRYQAVCPDCYPNPIPSLEARRSLQPGQGAKLRFERDGYVTERMWVQITRRLDDGGYVGVLVNDPMALPIKRGTAYAFVASDIVDIYDPRA